jgi:hypothetical protein
MSLSAVHIRYPESRKRYGQTGTVKLAGGGGTRWIAGWLSQEWSGWIMLP